MKRNSVYKIGKLSSNDLQDLKKDLFNHSLLECQKIKNLDLDTSVIEEVVNNSINHVFLRYDPKSGEILGNLVRTQVFADLRAKYKEMNPNTKSRVSWPDLAQRRAGKGFLELVEMLKSLSETERNKIIERANEDLTGKEQKMLSTILDMKSSITYTDIAEKLNVNSTRVTYMVKSVYRILNSVIKDLENA